MAINKIFIILFIVFLCTKKLSAQNDFDSYMNKFSNDSVFQAEHVLFPLKKIVLNDENFTLDTIYLEKKEYKMIKFYNFLIDCSEAYPIIYDNFELNESKSDKRVFRWKGYTGMDERYYFEKRKGCWILVKVEILGT